MAEAPELCAPEPSEGASGNQDSSGLTPELCQELESDFDEDSPLKLQLDLVKELIEDMASKQEIERPSEGEPREQYPKGEEKMTLEELCKGEPREQYPKGEERMTLEELCKVLGEQSRQNLVDPQHQIYYRSVY